MDYTGKIISIAFPDTFVRFSDESLLQVFPLFGLGKNKFIKAGHAAFVLIDNRTGEAEYYDFGRYITPKGMGRVRSAVTDVELEILIKASFTFDGKLENIAQFLLWLEAHPEKTHGNGRLVASVCDYIDYDMAKNFVLLMQEKGSMPYRAFGKGGCNCSRIVTDTILAGTDNRKIIKTLMRNKKFTPSPLGNVAKASVGNPIYQVEKGVITEYPGSVFKENLTNYFDKNIPLVSENQFNMPKFLKKAHFLPGTGSSAYFILEKHQEEYVFKITRYTVYGAEDFKGLFKTKDYSFDIEKKHQFVYDSHCKYCHIEQHGRKIRFDLVKKIVN